MKEERALCHVSVSRVSVKNAVVGGLSVERGEVMSESGVACAKSMGGNGVGG